MNGIHDLGGMHGFPDLGYERDEPVFHHEWERRCFALNFATDSLGRWNLDMWRHAVERMDPHEYLITTYYEHWLHAMETLLVEHGLLTREELDARLARISHHPPAADADPLTVTGRTPSSRLGIGSAMPSGSLESRSRSPRIVERPATKAGEDRGRAGDSTPAAATPGQPAALSASEVAAALRRGEPARREVEVPARFRPGDRVRTLNMHPEGHTRLPRYARAKRGVVRDERGVHLFPDRRARGQDDAVERLYGVEFRARELWGDDAAAKDTVRLDLWESYLEPA